MSVISQFFPAGGGGGGNETPGGVKIPQDGIPVEVLGISGAGGGGNSNGRGGGYGAIFHATNYFIQPGETVPITIGAGGAGGSQCPNCAGAQGGTTSFNYPILPLSVVGGGGGSGGDPAIKQNCGGCPGGNGGGGAGQQDPWNAGGPGGQGCYYKFKNEVFGGINMNTTDCRAVGGDFQVVHRAEPLQFPWGIKGGFPGSDGCHFCLPNGGHRTKCGCGGKAGGNGYTYEYFGPTPIPYIPTNYLWRNIPGQGYSSDIMGDLICLTGPPGSTNAGYTDEGSGNGGCAGALIVKWATVYGAATSSPGATDLSPVTPGYYTYCFSSSGQIGLP